MAGSEDYLDGLLNSVTKKLSEIDEASESKKDAYLPPRTNKALSQMREDQFLKEFEADLDLDEGDSFLSEYENDLDLHEEKPADPLENFDIGSLPDEPIEFMDEPEEEASVSDDFLDQVASDSLNLDLEAPVASSIDVPPKTNDSAADSSDIELGELPGSFEDEDELILEDAGDDAAADPAASNDAAQIEEAPDGMKDLESLFDVPEAPADDDDEQIIDESNLDQAIESVDLDNSDDDELAEIGKMLNEDTTEFQIDENNLADPDSFAQAESVTKAKSEKKKKEKKTKEKGSGNGFLSKFLSFMFGEDESESGEGIDIDGSDVDSAEVLTKESEKVLSDMEGEGESSEEDKGKKKKDKKEKKEKPKKEAKPKKEKPKKPPKPKKEKEPKGKPLPKVPVLLIVVMAASLFFLIYLGTNVISKANYVSAAKESFDKGDYKDAYEALAPIDRNEEEEALYNRAKTLAVVSCELDAYYSLVSIKKYDLAIDCLIRGLARTQIENARAEEWGCTAQMNALKKEIEKQLMDQFSMTGDQALEIYDLVDRDDYSVAIHRVLEGLGLRYN